MKRMKANRNSQTVCVCVCSLKAVCFKCTKVKKTTESHLNVPKNERIDRKRNSFFCLSVKQRINE